MLSADTTGGAVGKKRNARSTPLITAVVTASPRSVTTAPEIAFEALILVDKDLA